MLQVVHCHYLFFPSLAGSSTTACLSPPLPSSDSAPEVERGVDGTRSCAISVLWERACTRGSGVGHNEVTQVGLTPPVRPPVRRGNDLSGHPLSSFLLKFFCWLAKVLHGAFGGLQHFCVSSPTVFPFDTTDLLALKSADAGRCSLGWRDGVWVCMCMCMV